MAEGEPVSIPAEVTYNPRVASLYIQLKKSYSKAVDKLPQGGKPDVMLIFMIRDIQDGLVGIEMLLNPESQLKRILDNELRRLKLVGKEVERK